VRGQSILRQREKERVDEEYEGQGSSIESSPADDDVSLLHTQAKRKNKSLRENKSVSPFDYERNGINNKSSKYAKVCLNC